MLTYCMLAYHIVSVKSALGTLTTTIAFTPASFAASAVAIESSDLSCVRALLIRNPSSLKNLFSVEKEAWFRDYILCLAYISAIIIL